MSAFVVGYRGGQQLSGSFVDNPLAVMPNTHIMVYDTEVAPILARLGWGEWWQINPQQKSQIAREILLNRGTDDAHRQAEMLGLNIAAYSQITVITTPKVDSQSQGLASHFLM